MGSVASLVMYYNDYNNNQLYKRNKEYKKNKKERRESYQKLQEPLMDNEYTKEFWI